MFLRTQRLFLRPAWAEDAPELARAIGHEAVVRMLAVVPWPYALADAEASVARERQDGEPRFMITLPGESGRIIGGCGLGRNPQLCAGEFGVGYWIEPGSWGRGYASEMLAALVALAQSLGHRRLVAAHFVDNPASGRVMAKCGFRPTGTVERCHSLGRGAEVEAIEYAIDLAPGARNMPAAMSRAA